MDPAAATDPTRLRELSGRFHESGRWNTSVSACRNPIVRALWRFCSFKRSGVDRLADKFGPEALIMDLGAGNGAYSHWFLGRTPCTVVAVDWSPAALAKIPVPSRGSILRVCADISSLPIKPGIFDAAFSVDTLGHIPALAPVLDEALRVVRPGSPLFLHSECADYRERWPDRDLIHKSGKDHVASLDGHVALRLSSELRAAYGRRYRVRTFYSPAGILGWLLGYPENYCAGFKEARLLFWCIPTGLFAMAKWFIPLRALLRLVNALTNHIELFLGITGGGSCFALIEKPRDVNSDG